MVGLILAMMAMTAMGVAMISITGSGGINPVDAIRANQAAYLAEAGYRYVEREFRNVTDSDSDGDKEDDTNLAFAALHNQGRVLRDNQGRFDLGIYPYYVMTSQSHSAGATSLLVKFPGADPVAKYSDYRFNSPAYVRLKIGSDYYVFSGYSYDAGTATGTFTLSQPLAQSVASAKNIVFAMPCPSAQTLTRNGTLAVVDRFPFMFPLKNGTVSFKNSAGTFRYATRSGNQLKNITDRDNPEREFSVNIAAGEMITLEPFVDIYSTGTYGVAPETVQHEALFHVPLPTEQRVQVSDSFEDLSKWRDSEVGDQAIETIGGDKALRVTDAVGAGGFPKVSQRAFNPDAVNLDLSTYQQQAGRFLSYDTQIKVGFVTSATPPTQGYDDLYGTSQPVPKYYAGGLSFRLSGAAANATFLGLSFLRGDNSIGSPYDNLPDEIVPKNGKPLIVLWQQKAGGVRNWLAYKELTERGFSDNVESGDYVWTRGSVASRNSPAPGGLWNRTSPSRRWNSSDTSWYYGRHTVGNYDNGVQNYGELISTDINLTGASDAKLIFYTRYQTELSAAYDQKRVQVLPEGSSSWQNLKLFTEDVDTLDSDMEIPWTQFSLSLNAHLGKIVKVGFFFDTIDSVLNAFEGWYIDDVKVQVTMPSSSSDYKYVSALAVRLIEGASVSFTDGGPTAVRDGDVITQGTGVQATVKGDPIIASGSWTGNNAAGVLVLKNVSAPFVSGTDLAVVGSSAAALVTGYRTKDNFIRAYYGNFDTTDSGTANANAFDLNKRGNRRGQINWPPDSLGQWASSNDYFRQVKWDAVNTAGVATLTKMTSLDEPDAVIRNSESTFLTPSTGQIIQPEFGLHALGHGATNIFFDDFALQLDADSKKGFPHTIRE